MREAHAPTPKQAGAAVLELDAAHFDMVQASSIGVKVALKPVDSSGAIKGFEAMGTALPIVRDVASLRKQVSAWRAGGGRIGLVPTMGALHEGHLSLVRAAKAKCAHVVASLFVNPRQFAPHEDFERYPRDEAGDAKMLADAGCDLLFAPERAVMYPEGFATNVIVTSVSTPLEGRDAPALLRRRGHGGDKASAAGAARRGLFRREGLSAAPGDQAARARSRCANADRRLPHCARA